MGLHVFKVDYFALGSTLEQIRDIKLSIFVIAFSKPFKMVNSGMIAAWDSSLVMTIVLSNKL